MSTAPAAARHRRPYGLAFAIEDLTHIRQWAEERSLVMLVTLDRVINGAEFEEMIALSPPGRHECRTAMWRSFGTVYVQRAGSRPRGFTNVSLALHWLAPPRAERARRWWSLPLLERLTGSGIGR